MGAKAGVFLPSIKEQFIPAWSYPTSASQVSTETPNPLEIRSSMNYPVLTLPTTQCHRTLHLSTRSVWIRERLKEGYQISPNFPPLLWYQWRHQNSWGLWSAVKLTKVPDPWSSTGMVKRTMLACYPVCVTRKVAGDMLPTIYPLLSTGAMVATQQENSLYTQKLSGKQ